MPAIPRTGDRWSARAVLIHLGNWEAEAVTWFGCLLNNEPIPQSPQPIDEWNAEHMAAYAELDAWRPATTRRWRRCCTNWGAPVGCWKPSSSG